MGKNIIETAINEKIPGGIKNLPEILKTVDNVDALIQNYGLSYLNRASLLSFLNKKGFVLQRKWKCHFCQSEYPKKPSLKRHLCFCEKVHTFEKTFGVSSERVQELYDSGISILQIYNQYAKDTVSFAKFYKIISAIGVKYSLQKTSFFLSSRKIREETCIARHGYRSNMERNSKQRKEMTEGLKEKYGVNNVFQIPQIKEKCRDTMVRKYGTEQFKSGKLARGINSISKFNLQFYDFLEHDVGIENYAVELKLPYMKTYFQYDIVVGKKIIELQGDYWHQNPKLYTSSSILLKGSSGEKTAEEVWKKDKIKFDTAIKHGYNVMVIWESDFKKDRMSIKEQVKKFLEE